MNDKLIVNDYFMFIETQTIQFRNRFYCILNEYCIIDIYDCFGLFQIILKIVLC